MFHDGSYNSQKTVPFLAHPVYSDISATAWDILSKFGLRIDLDLPE